MGKLSAHVIAQLANFIAQKKPAEQINFLQVLNSISAQNESNIDTEDFIKIYNALPNQSKESLFPKIDSFESFCDVLKQSAPEFCKTLFVTACANKKEEDKTYFTQIDQIFKKNQKNKILKAQIPTRNYRSFLKMSIIDHFAEKKLKDSPDSRPFVAQRFFKYKKIEMTAQNVYEQRLKTERDLFKNIFFAFNLLPPSIKKISATPNYAMSLWEQTIRDLISKFQAQEKFLEWKNLYEQLQDPEKHASLLTYFRELKQSSLDSSLLIFHDSQGNNLLHALLIPLKKGLLLKQESTLLVQEIINLHIVDINQKSEEHGSPLEMLTSLKKTDPISISIMKILLTVELPVPHSPKSTKKETLLDEEPRHLPGKDKLGTLTKEEREKFEKTIAETKKSLEEEKKYSEKKNKGSFLSFFDTKKGQPPEKTVLGEKIALFKSISAEDKRRTQSTPSNTNTN